MRFLFFNIGDERALSWYFIRQNILNVRELRFFFDDFTCVFAISKITTTADSGQGMLRLDIVLRTNIIDKSGLFDIQGRPVPLEWVSWTHNCKTITLVAKNKGNVLLQLCRFPSD